MPRKSRTSRHKAIGMALALADLRNDALRDVLFLTREQTPRLQAGNVTAYADLSPNIQERFITASALREKLHTLINHPVHAVHIIGALLEHDFAEGELLDQIGQEQSFHAMIQAALAGKEMPIGDTST